MPSWQQGYRLSYLGESTYGTGEAAAPEENDGAAAPSPLKKTMMSPH